MNDTSMGNGISTQHDRLRHRVGLGLVAFAAAAAIFGAHAARQSTPAAAQPAPASTAAVMADADDTTEFYREHYGAVTPAESVAAYDR